jgi:DNA-binding PadR family transcriptional regulator
MNHSFSVELACKVGTNAAILFENIYFWCAKNEANEQNKHDDNYWTYNSISAFNKLFPYMSEKQITYSLQKLEKKGYIKTGNYNKVAYDHTKWYAITDFGKSILQNVQIDSSKMENRLGENGRPIPDINTDINTDNKPDIYKKSKKNEVRHQYGEYKHVLLSDSEYNKLLSDWGEEKLKHMIQVLDEGIEAKGYKYKNYAMALRTWEKNEKQYRSSPSYSNQKYHVEQGVPRRVDHEGDKEIHVDLPEDIF